MHTLGKKPVSSKATNSSVNSSCDNFGDCLGKVMLGLSSDVSAKFLKALSGLSASESAELCQYVLELSEQKKLRVIEAMAGSTVDGKKKFILNLRKKFEAKRSAEKQVEAEKQQTRQSAAARVKEFASAGNKYHSAQSLTKTGSDPASAKMAWSASKSKSSSDIAPADIHTLGKELYNAHISIGHGQSELHLAALERDAANKAKGIIKPKVEMEVETKAPVISKRERPHSNWELMKDDQSAEQRLKSEEKSEKSEDMEEEEDKLEAADGEGGDEDKTENDDDEDQPSTKRWTKAQDDALRESVRFYGEKNWKAIASRVPGRNHAQCLQRWRKVLKPGLVKGHWSYEEDQVLEALVRQGCNNWGQVAEQIPGRTPKQCRERWRNHLDPNINKGPYTLEEDAIILENQDRLGNRWSQIAQLLKGRTEDSVKIRWKSLKQNPHKAQAANRARTSTAWQQQQQQQQHQQQLHQQAKLRSGNPSPVSLGINGMVPPAFPHPSVLASPYHVPSPHAIHGNGGNDLLNIPDPTPFPYSSPSPSNITLEPGHDIHLGARHMNLTSEDIKREEQQMQMYLNQHNGDPHVEDLEDLVNTVKNITDELNFDFGFEGL